MRLQRAPPSGLCQPNAAPRPPACGAGLSRRCRVLSGCRLPRLELIARCQGQQEDGGEPSSSDGGSSSNREGSSSSVGTSTGSSSLQQPEPGSPLPGQEASLQIPKDVVEQLRYSVFGIDTMWVTSVDNYQQDGVVFKGNVRSDPGVVYEKMRTRLKDKLGDAWQIFLLEDKEEKPTAVVLPASAREGAISRTTEVWLMIVFGIASLATSIDSAGAPLLQFLIDPFRTMLTQQDLLDALPIASAFWLTLGAHELGHRWAAARVGASLYLPLIVPAGFGFIGSFGGITRFRGFVKDRASLLAVAEAGPAAGVAASGALLLLGLLLSSAGLGDVVIDSAAFADSLLVGLLGQFFLGDALAAPEVQVSSLLVAGWAGLAVNSLNLLPTGELDGGRIVLSLFGRRAYTALGVLSIIALGIASFNNTLAFYWVLLVLALQRGPILPCQQELSAPTDETQRTLGYALLALPLLVLLPFPIDLAVAVSNMQDPTPF